MEVSTLLKNVQSLDFSDEKVLDQFIADLKLTFEGEDKIKKLMTDDGVQLINLAFSSNNGIFIDLSFDHLKRCALSDEGCHFLCDRFLDTLLKYFFDDNVKYYQYSNDIFKLLIEKNEDMFKKFFNEKTVDLFKDKVKNGSSIIQSRIFSLISSTSYKDYAFDFYLEVSFAKNAIEGLNDQNDILMLVDTINRLSNIGTSKKGFDFIAENAYDLLLNMVKDEGCLSIIKSNVIQALGSLAKKGEYHIEGMLKRPLLQIVYEHFDHPEDEVVISCINFFSCVCETKKGIEEVLKREDIFNQWISYLYTSNAELKKITILSIADFLFNVPEKIDDELSNLRCKFYHKIDDEPSERFFKMMLSGHSDELKYNIYRLFISISKYDWGIDSLIKTKTFASYLLDRSTEAFKLGHELKYSIIRTMINHPKSKEIIGLNHYYLFVEYLKQGIFYKKAESTVLVEHITS